MTQSSNELYKQTAEIFLQDSSFVEIRLLGNGTAMSGFFSDAESAAQAIVAVDGKRNAYIVANPIRPDFGRGTFGKFVRALTGDCVSDADIAHHAWFKIDLDVKGKAKLSATQEEVDAAAAVRDKIVEFLAGLGWPVPLIGFSGNGWWLFYRTKLPNDELTKALFDQALTVLAIRFNGDGIELDLSAATAARLVPFFGTMKAKGEATMDRPHRRSTIVDLGSPDLVSREQLESLAAMAPQAGQAAPPKPSGNGFLKLEEMLDAAGIQHTSPKTVGDTTWYGIFGADGDCPFGDSSGNGGKCGVGQDKAGKLYGHCFAADHPWSEWRELLGLDQFFPGAAPIDGRPTIVLGAEMNVTTDQAWAAIVQLNDPPKLFAFGAMLVEIDGMTDANLIVVDNMRLRHKVDRAAHFRRVDAQGFQRPTPAPTHVIDDMLATRPFPVPEIVAVVRAPFFTPSGRLVLEPGYDSETKRYLQLPDELRALEVPTQPTAGELQRSLTVIEDLLYDFPFVSDADWANAIAKLLDPFTRTMHDSITPLYVFSAPTPGTGKGLLADVLTIPATGGRVMRTPIIKGEAELAKRLFALLLEGTDHVHFDNLEGSLNSATLSSFLTSEVYSDRILGKSTMPSFPQRVNMSLSGNNVIFGGDIPRRVALIRLDARVEKPQGRGGFKHEHICDWALENRAVIVEACLIVVQAWVNAGMKPGSVTLGSFERWARTSSGILQHAGIPGLLENRKDVEEMADVEGDAWLQWVLAWEETFGNQVVKAGDLIKLVELVDYPPFYVADDGTEKSMSIRIGKALMTKKDRIYGGFAIRLSRVDGASRSKLWKLERVDKEERSSP